MSFSQFFFTIVVPFSLFAIMVGLGLSLTIKDLVRVVIMPKAALIGLAAQMFLLPILAFSLALIFSPPPVIAIGLILLAACPGGITSNAYVFASRGDVALSVTMTSISSLLIVFTLPLLTYLALKTFSESGVVVQLPFWEIMSKLAMLTVFPIALGMTARGLWPEVAGRLVEPVRKIAITVLIIVILGNTIVSFDTVVSNFLSAGLVALLLNILSMSMGYGIARLANLTPHQVVAITYEVGVQNISLVLTLAMAILFMPDYSVTALVYGLFMKITALSFLVISKRILARDEAARVAESPI